MDVWFGLIRLYHIIDSYMLAFEKKKCKVGTAEKCRLTWTSLAPLGIYRKPLFTSTTTISERLQALHITGNIIFNSSRYKHTLDDYLPESRKFKPKYHVLHILWHRIKIFWIEAQQQKWLSVMVSQLRKPKHQVWKNNLFSKQVLTT